MKKLENIQDSIPDFKLETYEDSGRIIKVNLRNSENEDSEGIWAFLVKEEDKEKYDKGVGTFEVALLNDPLMYFGLLNWGDFIKVDGNGPENRPRLNIDFAKELIKEVKV